MPVAIRIFRIKLLILFLVVSTQPIYCQVNSLNWPCIQFTNQLLEINLSEFVHVAQSQFIHLSIKKDSLDSGYIYRLYEINNFETVQEFNSSTWGRWKKYIILIYTQANSELVYHIANRSSSESLRHYAEQVLPKMIITLADGKTQQLIGGHGGEGPEVEFKIVKEQEIYYHDRGGVRVREMPIDIPSVPKSTKKQ